MRRYPVTFGLLGLCILLHSLGQLVVPDLANFLAFKPGSLTALPTLVTYQLVHGSWGHLLGNFSFGLPFMLYLEYRLGRRMLEYFFLTGIAAALCHMLVAGTGGALIGSSGSMFGVMVGACMAFGDTLEEHVLSLLFLAVLVVPQLQYGVYGLLMGSPVAFFGHVGGALGGLMLSHTIHKAD